jgi:hypothetical protein
MMRVAPTIIYCLLLPGCAVSVGVVPVGPDTYAVSERRAPVLGGGPEAQRVALAEATGFCAQQGRVFAPLVMGAVGNPYSAYGPSGFTTTFRCKPAGDPATATAPHPN